MRTAYVPRPYEHGPDVEVDREPEEYIDIIADDFVDLSKKLTVARETGFIPE